MFVRKINAEESIFIKNKFDKSVKNSFLFIFFMLLFLTVFIYCLTINWIEIVVVKFLLILLIGAVSFLLINSIYSIITIYKKIKNCHINCIKINAKVIKKDIRTFYYESASNTEYFMIYFEKNPKYPKSKIYVNKEVYNMIKENNIIEIIFYETVNIIKEAVYQGEKLKDVSF